MRAERAIGGGMKWVVLSVWLNIKAIINCKKFSKWKWLQGRKVTAQEYLLIYNSNFMSCVL